MGHHRARAADEIERLVQLAGDLLALLHQRAALGETRLLAGLRIEGAEFLHGVAQEVGLLLRRLDPGALLGERRAGGAHALGGGRDRGERSLKAAEGVEDGAVRGGVGQRPVVVLAMDFHERGADRPHGLHADRLVVDEGAGAPVGELGAAQDQVAVGVDLGRRRDGAGGVIQGHVEHRGDAALRLAVAHEPAIAAPAEARAKASSRIDLPAPVSPVRTVSPPEKARSSLSIRTMSRIASWTSMQAAPGPMNGNSGGVAASGRNFTRKVRGAGSRAGTARAPSRAAPLRLIRSRTWCL